MLDVILIRKRDTPHASIDFQAFFPAFAPVVVGVEVVNIEHAVITTSDEVSPTAAQTIYCKGVTILELMQNLEFKTFFGNPPDPNRTIPTSAEELVVRMVEASDLKRTDDMFSVLELSLWAIWNGSGRKAADMAVWSPALALEHVRVNLPV